MKNPFPALVAAALLLSSSTALCASDDGTVANRALWQMAPAEIAKLVHEDGRTWVERTIYSRMALGSGVSGVVLYARPEPASGPICRVTALSLSADKAEVTGNELRYRLGKRATLVYYAVAEDFEGKGEVSLAEACHRMPVHSDFMRRSGAENLFSASSPEIAASAVGAVAAMENAVGRTGSPLPFDLVCENSNERFCGDARGTLAKMFDKKMESVEPCPDALDTCLVVAGFYGFGNGRDSCTLHIGFRSESMESIDHVRMSCVTEPFF